MWIADGWKDYEVIDSSKGEKLERWGNYLLVRPDPQVIWDTPKTHKGWKKMNGHYHRSKKGGGEWEFFDLPEQWQIHYKNLTFNLKPFSFKHTGLFPEQATNWDWFSEKIKQAGRPIKVLNLFAYTGGATLAAAAAGASVTHVDASKGMVAWAKENAVSSGLEDAPIRWLVDDCVKFVEREIRRGNHYDAIIMDPPSYGRGPKGEIWKIEDAIHPLVKLCTQILSDNPLFFLINSYTTGLAPAVLTYMLATELKKWNGSVDSQEIGLPVSDAPIRWLVDDCVKFVEREIRRGNHYDAIIMDPPSYGRGPKGEIWKIEDAIHPLVKLCTQILSDNPLFFLINSYTTGLAPAVLTYMLATELKKWNGSVDSQEIGLPVSSNGLVLPCGASGRWEAHIEN